MRGRGRGEEVTCGTSNLVCVRERAAEGPPLRCPACRKRPQERSNLIFGLPWHVPMYNLFLTHQFVVCSLVSLSIHKL